VKTAASSLAAALLLATAPSATGAETRQAPGFAPNPGDLLMLGQMPDGLPRGAVLVVLLHGYTQRAAGFADASGWAALAERHRFALLLPEQQAANNRDLCFNFFLPGNNRRGRGEAASIRAMVDRALADHGLDPKRVFVAGLSAGGGIAAALLAAYPETFTTGAVVAGVPYGCASVEGRPVLAAQKRWFLLTNPFGEAG
jgi:poly(hydroxyalkanoate) depolymerase family esterase